MSTVDTLKFLNVTLYAYKMLVMSCKKKVEALHLKVLL